MRSLLAFLLALTFAFAADASTCTTSDFSTSGILTADRLNQRFHQVAACVNGNLGNTNVTSSDPIAASKLATPNAIFSQAFTLADERGAGATVGTVGPTATTLAKWRVPVSSTIIGWTAVLRCPTDANCNTLGESATVTLKVAGVSQAQFTSVATNATQSNFALAVSAANTNDITLEVSGTLTGVQFIDVVVFEKAQLQG